MNNSIAGRRPDCRLCRSRDLELVLTLAPAPLVDAYVPPDRAGAEQASYPLDLFLCSACGHAQLLDVIDPETLYRDYLYETTSSLGLPEHFESYAQDVMARIKPAAGSLAVDIGSNDGTLLGFFQKAGLRGLGFDPAREIARKATASGIETLPDYFTTAQAQRILQERGPASVITTNNMFANVDEPSEIIEGMRTLLAPDGVYVLEFMYMADLIENFVFDYIYHEHLSYFSVKPLASYLETQGLEVIDVQRVSTKGGSLRMTVQRKGGPRPISGSVARMVAFEKKLGVHDPATYRAFSKRIDAAKTEVLGLLTGLKAQGHVIAAYGASATSTTFIYHFGLTGLIDFFVDDFKLKQGLLSPGVHIPVLPSSALYDKKPQTTLMVAWRYAEPIMRKHRSYIENGGQFVVPLPTLRVHKK